nr:reverse transcriptase domain-containing protein [Tanacetum cinerariifolium]
MINSEDDGGGGSTWWWQRIWVVVVTIYMVVATDMGDGDGIWVVMVADLHGGGNGELVGCWELMGKVVGVVWRWWSGLESRRRGVNVLAGNKSDFRWTMEAEQAFQQLKQHLSALPLLAAPKPQEELIMYLSATHGAISAVLMTERGTVQMPVYFISRALQGPKLNYSPMEKLVLSLVFAAKRLRRYFQAHPITVITDQPIKQVMSRPDVAGRLQKWSIMLGEHNITYRPRTSIKRQILADFLNEMPSNASQGVPVAETQENRGRSSNNEAEYEALIAGLRIAKQMGVKNIQANVDSKRVLVEVLETKSITGKKVTAVIEEEGPTWMTELVNYLKEGTLPEDEKKARKFRLKARQYELMKGILYKRSFLTP